MKRLKIVLLIVAALFTLWVCLSLTIDVVDVGLDGLRLIYGDDQLRYSDWPFDAQLWRSSEQSDQLPSPRYRMAKSLVERHLRFGMSEHQVTTMLGSPELSPYIDEDGLHQLHYWLGVPFDHGSWYRWRLVLYFNEDNKYVRYECDYYG